MYPVDGQDEVLALRDLPPSSVGAPCPIVIAGEGSLVVAYLAEARDERWDGKTVREVGPETAGEPAALVRFTSPRASTFGPPNDEAFSGHPLYARGLRPYGAYEVRRSSWIRALERMNRVHPCHRPESYAELRHFVLAFHDSTFECVAEGYAAERASGPLTELAAREASRLRG